MTDDDRPRGSCLIDGCSRDPYPREDGRLPLVCGPHVSQARHWLSEIPAHAGELGRQLTDASMPDPNGKDISILLPSMATSAPRSGGRVSGSVEPRLPIAVDVVDLLGPRRPLRYADLGEDAAGFDSVWSVLSFWCIDLAEHRGLGERGRRPEEQSPIPWLANWLLVRVDEAADDWPLFAEFFTDMGRLHGALRNLLGLVEVPDYRDGVPCPKCHLLSLVRQSGGDWVVCGSCGAYLKITEYEEYVMTLATALSTEEREKRKKATAERRALWRLIRCLREVGWRHAIDHQVDHDPETGAPEPYRTHRWTRGEESIELDRHGGRLAGYLLYRPHPDADADEMVCLGVGWLAVHRVKRLTSVALAAGVLDPAGWRDAVG